jgi:hypothetical protein
MATVVWRRAHKDASRFVGAVFDLSHAIRSIQQIGRDEPPPCFSVQRGAAIRERLVRSTVTVGGGRSPLTFGPMKSIAGGFAVGLAILAAGGEGVATFSKEFIRDPGEYCIDSSGSMLKVAAGSPGSWSLVITWRQLDATFTALLDNCLVREGWFVYVEQGNRIWVYDGCESGALLNYADQKLRSAAFSTLVLGLGPEEVWEALPEHVKLNYGSVHVGMRSRTIDGKTTTITVTNIVRAPDGYSFPAVLDTRRSHPGPYAVVRLFFRDFGEDKAEEAGKLQIWTKPLEEALPPTPSIEWTQVPLTTTINP